LAFRFYRFAPRREASSLFNQYHAVQLPNRLFQLFFKSASFKKPKYPGSSKEYGHEDKNKNVYSALSGDPRVNGLITTF
jgi:hypothetical protein